MPWLSEEAPSRVDIDRLSEVLPSTGKKCIYDPQNHMFMLTCSLATVYVDLDHDVLRVRSVWRGSFSDEEAADALSFVSRWNRESVGPKGIVYLNEESVNRLSAQTNHFIGVGMSQTQLEACLLLSVIMSHRFFTAFENEVLSREPYCPGGTHLSALAPHELTYVPQSHSDNSCLSPLDSDRLLSTCARLGWRPQRQGTVIELTVSGRPLTVRLFGENTWLSLSTEHRPDSVMRVDKDMFLRMNSQNSRWPFPVLSVMGSGSSLGLRSNFTMNVGEGMTDRQLDTQLMLGTLAVNQIVDAFNRVSHPHVFH